MKKLILNLSLFLITLAVCLTPAMGEGPAIDKTYFDDTQLLNGYTEKYREEPKAVILAMIKDDTINPYQMTAAIRVFKDLYSQKVTGHEKLSIERDLIHRINKTNSAFVETEIMNTLCLMDRYKFFAAMVPALILKMDHYNVVVNNMAYDGLKSIIAAGKDSKREARIVFKTLRNVLFLARNTLKHVRVPDDRLSKKLDLLRWSIKILGSQEVKRLPKQIIHLL